MQEYKKIDIKKEDIVPLAKRMRESGVMLAMIHAYKEEDGTANVSYEYDIPGGIESYTVRGENVLPTISHIYDKGAEWPEREIMELMDITFEGVDTSKRLFLPESMLSEQGQILITPMEELLKEKKEEEEQ